MNFPQIAEILFAFGYDLIILLQAEKSWHLLLDQS
jgi:hypothetical protein